MSNEVQWGKIATGVMGGLLLALQGINLTELGNVATQGNARAETLKQIEQEGMQRAAALKDLSKSLDNQTRILENGSKLLDADSRSLVNQEKMLNLLEKGFERRKAEQSYPPPDTEYAP